MLTDFQKHFKVLGRLAGGAFSTVYAGINILSHEEVALKVISKGSLAPTDQHHDEIQILKNEIVILEQLRHWQLSPLIEVYETPDCVVMVLRQASAGNML